jgi:hypothetical protein
MSSLDTIKNDCLAVPVLDPIAARSAGSGCGPLRKGDLGHRYGPRSNGERYAGISWSALVCRTTRGVTWRVDNAGLVSELSGNVYSVCLQGAYLSWPAWVNRNAGVTTQVPDVASLIRATSFLTPYSAACCTGASSTADTFGGDIGRL